MTNKLHVLARSLRGTGKPPPTRPPSLPPSPLARWLIRKGGRRGWPTAARRPSLCPSMGTLAVQNTRHLPSSIGFRAMRVSEGKGGRRNRKVIACIPPGEKREKTERGFCSFEGLTQKFQACFASSLAHACFRALFCEFEEDRACTPSIISKTSSSDNEYGD